MNATGPVRASSRPRSGTNRPFATRAARIAIPLIVAVGVLHAVAPSGISRSLVFAAIAVVDLTGVAVCLVRGGRPRFAWTWAALAFFCFISGLGLRLTSWRLGHWPISDVVYVTGYAAASIWLLGLTWTFVGRAVGRRAVFDTVLAVVATVLVLWSVSAVFHREILPLLVWALYPVLDILVIAAATHLTFRITRVAPAWWWIYCGLFVELFLDTVFAVHGLSLGHRPVHHLYDSGYLWAMSALVIGATHPSVRFPPLVPSETGRLQADHLPSLFIGLSVMPVLSALFLPTTRSPLELAWYAAMSGVLIVLSIVILYILTGLAQSEAESHFHASHDLLTGIYNRRAFSERLAERLRRDALDGRHTALLLLDCDDFKDINDTWGHPAGDAVLIGIAGAIRSTVGPDGLVARHGGDEFVVASTVADLDEAMALADRLRTSFAEVLPVLPQRMRRVTPSIGVALSADISQDPAGELFRRADLALFAAKDRGRNQLAAFDQELADRRERRTVLESALRDAIRDGGIRAAFQPVFTGPGYRRLAGFESLARWVHPTLGPISPGEFIPLAEETGLIAELGESMLRTTAHDLARVREGLGDPGLVATVNVSAPQLLDPGFIGIVESSLADARLAPDALVLEITESLLVDEDSPALRTIELLREMGLSIALDDFGTGYASMTTLLRLPLDYVKVDRSIVARLDERPEAVLQLRAVLHLITSLGVSKVVAEGVETAAQAAALDFVGYPLAQGFLLGRPVPPADLLDQARRGALDPEQRSTPTA